MRQRLNSALPMLTSNRTQEVVAALENIGMWSTAAEGWLRIPTTGFQLLRAVMQNLRVSKVVDGGEVLEMSCRNHGKRICFVFRTVCPRLIPSCKVTSRGAPGLSLACSVVFKPCLRDPCRKLPAPRFADLSIHVQCTDRACRKYIKCLLLGGGI